MRKTLILVASLLVSANAVGSPPIPLGSPFQVNTDPIGSQREIDIAVGEDRFVVMWRNAYSNQDPPQMSGQRFSVDGSPMGGQFEHPNPLDMTQRSPAVAVQADGSFMVVWTGNGTLRAQAFNADATPAASSFVVEDRTGPFADGFYPADIAPLETGDFVVAVSGFYIGSYYGVAYGSTRRSAFSPNGDLRGLTATNPFAFAGAELSLDQDHNGDFVVSKISRYGYFEVAHSDASGLTGSYITPAVDVGSHTSFLTMDAAVQADGDVQFVWGMGRRNPPSGEIFGTRLDSLDQPAGPVVQINSFAEGNQFAPRIARAHDGSFMVVWFSEEAPAGQDNWGTSIRGRLLDADGIPAGDEFQVNVFTANDQLNPEIAASPDGQSFLVAWESERSDNDADGTSIRARRYKAGLIPPLFSDGFETGDTDAWDVSVP